MSDDVYAGLRWRPFWTGLPTETTTFSAASQLPILVPLKNSVPPLVDWDVEPSLDQAHNLTIQVLTGLKCAISEDGRLKGVDELVAQTKVQLAWDSVLPTWRRLAQGAVCRKTVLTAKLDSQEDELFPEEVFHFTTTGGKFSAIPSAKHLRDEYFKTRRNVCFDRRFFTTSDGRFGIGPKKLKAGDEVHIALGMQVPIILRKAKDEWGTDESRALYAGWLYIGQAYIHDLMLYKGDLLDDIETGRVELEQIVLV